MPRSLALLFSALLCGLTPTSTYRLTVVFSAECNSLFDWHSIAIFYSFETSNFSRSANLTRLLACSDEQMAAYSAGVAERLCG